MKLRQQSLNASILLKKFVRCTWNDLWIKRNQGIWIVKYNHAFYPFLLITEINKLNKT